jgi:hypothetical protein
LEESPNCFQSPKKSIYDGRGQKGHVGNI